MLDKQDRGHVGHLQRIEGSGEVMELVDPQMQARAGGIKGEVASGLRRPSAWLGVPVTGVIRPVGHESLNTASAHMHVRIEDEGEIGHMFDFKPQKREVVV